MPTPRRMSFFDVGGLLDGSHSSAYPQHPPTEIVSPIIISYMTHGPPSPPSSERRRGGHVLLENIEGLLPAPEATNQNLLPQQEQTQSEMTLRPAPTTRNFSRSHSRNEVSHMPFIEATASPAFSLLSRKTYRWHDPALQDAGGLLS